MVQKGITSQKGSPGKKFDLGGCAPDRGGNKGEGNLEGA